MSLLNKYFENCMARNCCVDIFREEICDETILGCVVNRFVLYYANVKKGCRENGECIRTT